MGHIKKIKRKKGTVYRAEVRRRGHQYTSKTFSKLTEAREWSKRMEKMLKLLSNSSSDKRVSLLEDEIEQLKKEIKRIKEGSPEINN